MAIELLEDTAATVELYPDCLPASGSLTVYKPGGSSLATPTVSVDSVDTTVDGAPTSQTVFDVASASGIVAGRRYWLGGAVEGGVVLVSEISGTTITLEAPPPHTVANGDAFKGLRCTASLTATHTADRGRNYRLEWLITDSGGDTHSYRQIAHVTRTRFRDPVASSEAARYIAAMYPNWAGSTIDSGHYREIARRASERVRRRLVAKEMYPHLLGDPEMFADAGLVALRIELTHEGLYPPGSDAGTYLMEQEEHLGRAIDEAIAGSWYDADDSGSAEEETETRRMGSISLVRL